MRPTLAGLLHFFLGLIVLAEVSATGVAQDPEALLRRAVAMMNASRPVEAEELVRETLNKDPSQADANILLGFLCLQRAAPAQAAQAFQKALDLRPASPPARLGLGMSWIQRGFPLKASHEFEMLLEDRSLGHKARAQWIYSLVLLGKDEQAFREARDTVGRFPHVAEYHSLLAFLYQLRGNSKDSLREYKRSLELDPRRIATYFSLISRARLDRDWHAVLEWSERALALDDSHPLLFEEMPIALLKLG